MRLTKAMELLAQASEAGGSLGAAAYVARMYAQNLDQSGSAARAAAAYSGHAEAYLGTTGGEKKYAETAAQEDRASAAQARLQQRQAALEGQRQQTPEYQRATAEKAGAQAAESLNALRARVLGQQAGAERAATPQGAAEYRERRALTQQGKDAEVRQAQSENIAQYGQLGGGIRNAYDSFQRGRTAMDPFIKGLGAGAAAATAAAASMYGLIAAASPSATSTFQNSLALASASVGKYFIPALDQMSGSLQNFAKWAGQQRPEDAGKAWRFGSGSEQEADPKGFFGALSATVGKWSALRYREETDYEKKHEPARDIDPRLQSKTYGSFAEYGKDIQTAGLNAGNQQAANKLLEEQLRVLTEQGQLLRDLKDNTDSLKNFKPLFA